MTLKIRLAAMMIALLVAVMGLQYLLMQREQSDLARRIDLLTREIDESTRYFSEHSLAMAAACEDSVSIETVLEWIEGERPVVPDSVRGAVVFVREDDSSRVEVRHLLHDGAGPEGIRGERKIVRELGEVSRTRLGLPGRGRSDTAAVQIVVPASFRGGAAESLREGQFEILKVNLPFPAGEEGGGHSIQLQYSMGSLTEELTHARRRSWFWLAALLGVGATGAVLVAVQFTRPIRSLQTSFGRVVEGDLNVQVDPRRPDEIGKLTQSFNDMVARLRETRVMEKRLSEAERLAAVGRLAAGIAHEVRNPLNAMLLTMQQLSDKTAPPPGTTEREQFDRYSEMVTGELGRLDRLVGTFLDLSRTGEAASERVDLGQSMSTSIALFEPQAAEQGVALDSEIEDGIEIEGDPERLRTVWNNLISNALQATAAGGRILFRARSDDEGVAIDVVDDGSGIDPDKLPHIWEPFFSGRPDGAGLGLSLVRSIVERHGGRVAAESEMGTGTRIRIRIPRTHTGAEQEEA